MLIETVRFALSVIAHNDKGEKIEIKLISEKRSRTISILQTVGVNLGWTTLYTFTKKRGYPMRKNENGNWRDLSTREIEEALHIRLGEFIHEPIVYVQRVKY